MCESDSGLRRILIIDDNRAIHEDFKKILGGGDGAAELADAEAMFFGDEQSAATEISYEVDSAFQGKDGFEMVKAAIGENRAYDMAFVDMRMPPGWDGVETIENLWKVDPQLQVVICSAYSDYSWSDFSERFGHRDNLLILKKPFDNVEVLQVAATFTEKRALTRQVQERLSDLEALVKDRTHDIQVAHEESERLLASIASLLIELDGDGVIQRWNATAERVLGIAAHDVIGQSFTSLKINWQDALSFFASIEGGTSADHERHEVSFIDSDERGHVVEFFMYPVRNNDENDGLLILGTDITEHRQLEQQLNQAQKLESVGQLAAGVAHEINTPMQYIGDNVQYLSTSWKRLTPLLECLEALDETAAADESLAAIHEKLTSVKLKKLIKMAPEAFADAEEGVQHVSRIVKAMKEFSHPGCEERSPVDLNRALDTTIVVAKNEWKYVADVETDWDPELPLISGFGGELNQVFLNLLVNAAHAISSATEGGANGKGKIRIATSHDRDTCTVTIEDSGGGIPAEIAKKVFDPFFTTKDVGKGTGQGLAIAYQVVVQKHGGQLWFDAEPNVGTKFFVQLPVEESSLSSEKPNANAADVSEDIAATMAV